MLNFVTEVLKEASISTWSMFHRSGKIKEVMHLNKNSQWRYLIMNDFITEVAKATCISSWSILHGAGKSSIYLIVVNFITEVVKDV